MDIKNFNTKHTNGEFSAATETVTLVPTVPVSI
jgi:hypothetical protein